MSLTVILLASLLSAPAIPACLQDVIKAEVRAPAALHPAPTLEPARGPSGSAVSIDAEGFAPGELVTFAAVRAQDGCSARETFLGQVPAGADGIARLAIEWPRVSGPVHGGARAPALPGTYWVIAMPCAARGACSLANGSAPGGPFRLTPSGGATVWPYVLGALVVVGVALRRRRARARGSR